MHGWCSKSAAIVVRMGARTLIVEDERIVARDLANILEDAGHDIVGVLTRGSEVLDEVRALRKPFDDDEVNRLVAIALAKDATTIL